MYYFQLINLQKCYVIFSNIIFVIGHILMKSPSQQPQFVKTHKASNSSLQQTKIQLTNQTTIAQLNKVSLKQNKHSYNPNTVFRIKLPQFFNLPGFKDDALPFNPSSKQGKNKPTLIKQDAVFKKRMKDLSILAQGMKRAKNLYQQSRYYFTQAVLLHNIGQYLKSIQYLQKFLKIVIYLQDSKSVELALNSIGCAYSLMADYQKAIQFHTKQGEVSNRADQYISVINIGICHQLKGDAKKAYTIYQDVLDICSREEGKQDLEERQQACNQLVQRLQNKMRMDEVFMTQDTQRKSPQKSIKTSLIKQESSLIIRKGPSRKYYQKAKFQYAISAAEQSLEEHLKSSIKFQQSN